MASWTCHIKCNAQEDASLSAVSGKQNEVLTLRVAPSHGQLGLFNGFERLKACTKTSSMKRLLCERKGSISQVKNPRPTGVIAVEVRWEEWITCSVCIPRKRCLATEQVKIAENYLQGLSTGKPYTYGQSRTGSLHPNEWKSTGFRMSPSTHSFAILKSSEKMSQAVGIQHLPKPLKGIWREKLAVSTFSVFSAV